MSPCYVAYRDLTINCRQATRMHFEPWMNFVQDLAILLAVAAGVNILLGRFRMPIFMGYLMAGVLVSSGYLFFSPIGTTDNLKLWSEIGIIFLLFTIGLEFSITDFVKIGTGPIKTGLFETLSTLTLLTLGFLSLKLNWSVAISLAACFTISSTAIIMKSFQEYNLKGVRFVKHVFGILVFEDIAVILLLLVLPTIAVSNQFSGSILVEKSLFIISFLFFSLILGLSIIPRLQKPLTHLNTEGLLIFASGLALLTASASQAAGLSFGLGAFIAGSLLAQIPKREKIMEAITPIRNLFMAIFFVATGMLLKLDGFAHALLPAIALSTAVILIKFFVVTIGSLLSRESLKNSIRSGITMTAMGEFTLLTAQIALGLKLINAEHFQVIVMSVFLNITFFVFTFRKSEQLAVWIEAHLPQSLTATIEAYRQPSASIHLSSIELFKQYYLNHFVLNSVVVVIITFITQKILDLSQWTGLFKSLLILTSLLVSLPLFWGLVFFKPKLNSQEQELLGERLERYQGVFLIARSIFAVTLFIYTSQWLMGIGSSLILLAATITALFLMRRELGKLHHFIAKKTKESMHFTEKYDPQKDKPKSLWDAQVSELTLSANSSFAGMTLFESQLRDQYNVLVTAIDRGNRRIYAPARYTRLFPSDRIFVVGTEEDILKVRHLIEASDTKLDSQDLQDTFGLESFDIPHDSLLNGQSIRDSFLRNEGGSLIIGIERQGTRLLNPDSATILKSGDRLWFAGEQKELLKKIKLLETQTLLT